ncbi:MAG: bifunctional UDP-sugar hydrolase/5'-nucleotidase, partial [Lachnospiraceae bacterium]|nr:bifunctional UDP-sugar hydrolase/5'-nucleotidase [Lachnospiraceae bacterium]
MNKKYMSKYILGILITCIVTLTGIHETYALDSGTNINVLFTSDIHSNILCYEERVNGRQINVGGVARLKTLIDEKRAEDTNTVLVDCGDIVMGTLSQALMDTEAVELSFLCEAGYDAITYGNHEFDYGAKALSDMYEVAANKYDKRPAFVNCNIDWNASDEYTKNLKSGMDKYGINQYAIIDKNGVKIAITGVLGYDAIKCAPTCELTFLDTIESVKKTVDLIKEKENPDMIICLSHSGTGSVLGKTEDEILAKEVPDIDLLISGHSHTELFESIEVGDTHIVSCGAYGLYTGDVSLSYKPNGRWELNNYELVLMDEKFSENPEVLAEIDRVCELFDKKILAPYNIKSKDIITINDNIEFESVQDMYDYHTETKLGNLLSDALRYEANLTPTGQEKPFDISVVPAGVVRDTILKGNINVDDVFSVFSLGTGPDGNVGYPLVSIYLTGKELKTVVEIDASISDFMNSARL